MSTEQFTNPALAAHRQARATGRLLERVGAMPVLMAGTFMVVLDFFIVNVALPSMQHQLHAGSGSLEWVVAGYGLAVAVALISAGRLGDTFGRRRILCAGLILFTLASAACGAAPDASVLVASRIVQGLGAAMISPTVLSIIGVLYAGAARAKALATYGMVLGLAALSGQLIGGALINLDAFGLGWRSCFLINLPIGALALALARPTIAESRAERRPSPDLTGNLLLATALVALILPLVDGRQQGWPVWSWCSLAVAPLLLVVLVAHQRHRAARGHQMLLSQDLMRERAFTGGLALQLLFWAGQASFFLVLALYLQDGRDLSALQAGGVFTIMASTYLVASVAAPRLGVRYGRTVVTAGALTLAVGHAALWASIVTGLAAQSIIALMPGLALVGAGMGLCIAPLTAISLAPLDPESAGEASGALSTVQQIGNSIGVAVTGAIFFAAARHGIAHAFELSVAELGVLLAAVAVFSRVLPPK